MNIELEKYMETLTKDIIWRVGWLDRAISVEPDIPKVRKELKELQEKFNTEINNVL